MAAILLTSGPVSTHKAARKLKKYLSSINISQFIKAATNLERLGLGSLVSMMTAGSRPCHVFVKKRPEEVRAVLMDNADLCSVEDYEDRYHNPLPAAISPPQVTRLIELGFVTVDQINPAVRDASLEDIS